MVDTTMPDMQHEPKKRSIIPYYFFAFFFVVFSVNGIMVYVAQSTWTGLETKNHYLKGLSYNNNLEGAREMQALGWQRKLEVAHVSGMTAKLTLSVTGKDGQPLRNALVVATAIRPTHYGYDQEFTLTETAPGIYETAITFPLEGQWDIRQMIEIGHDSLQEIDRFNVSKNGLEKLERTNRWNG